MNWATKTPFAAARCFGRIGQSPIQPPRVQRGRRGNPTGAPYPIMDNNTSTACLPACICRTNGKSCPSSRSITARASTNFQLVVRQRKPVEPARQPHLQPTDSTTLHAGYARYFTPPPVENVSGSTWRNSTAPRTRPEPTGRSGQGRARELLSTPASARKSRPDCRWAGRLLQNRPEPARRRIVRADAHPLGVQLCQGPGLWRGIHRLLQPRRFSPMPTSPGRSRRAKTGIRRNSCLVRPGHDWPMSKITGFIWTTTSASPARSARLTLGTNRRVAARAFMWTRFTAAACDRTAAA
jgi:hypothetical protein